MVTENTANDTTPATVTEEAKSFLETAQEAIGDAFESTVEAAKEHPVAAAAIAAGAAAAVAGAAYGISQLLGEEEPAKKK